MPYNRPYRTTARGRARKMAARRIQKFYRGRRRRPRNRQRYNRTKNVLVSNVGRRGRRLTVKKRLNQLEAGSKHHWDKASLTGELISWNGTDLIPTTKNSYSGLLAIQGPLSDGTAHESLKENEQRINDTVYCTSVRIRGEVRGIRPQDLGTPAFQPATDPSGMNLFGQSMMASLCATRVQITILQDMRPSVVDSAGQSDVNPLPISVAGGGPGTALASLYDNPTVGSSLQFFGVENALRSYESTRFKIVHNECIETSLTRPSKFFDINVKVNKKLKFVPAREGAAQNPPKVPYNYNLLVFFSMLSHPVQLPWSPYLSPASVTTKSSRCYFTDS
jgi:hypothetical protein